MPADKKDGAKAEKPKAEKQEKKDEAKTSGKDGKHSKKKSGDTDATPEGRLARLRPRRRLIFFTVFAGSCIWILAVHNPCDAKLIKKKEDCGWSGVSATECRIWACFLKGGGSKKKIITVKREKNSKFGVKLDTSDVKSSGVVQVNEIEDGGAFAVHNAKLPEDSEDRIQVGDLIVKFDGESGTSMLSAFKNTAVKDYKMAVRRSALLPGFLRRHSFSKHPVFLKIDQALTSPGFMQWSGWFMKVGGAGLSCWLLSGYPVSSVPAYLTFAAAVSIGVTRCCHDDEVKSGPHCYKPIPVEVETLLPNLFMETVAFAKKVMGEPQEYFGFMTSWKKDFEWIWKK